MSIKEKILELAKKRRAKVSIGLLDPMPEIIESLKKAQELVDVVIIGAQVDGFECVEATKDDIEEKQIDLILSGEHEGQVRGQSDTYTYEDLLAKKGNYDRSKIMSLGLYEDAFGRTYFTSSGSHADGWTKVQKKYMCDILIQLAKDFEIKPKIGFLTWVRPGSLGRNFFFDPTFEQAEDLVKHYTEKGYEAVNYNIEIEKALDDQANIIIFANGTSGNMHNRTYAYCANIMPLALPQTGIKENITQNSRNYKDYYNLVLYCAARANIK